MWSQEVAALSRGAVRGSTLFSVMGGAPQPEETPPSPLSACLRLAASFWTDVCTTGVAKTSQTEPEKQRNHEWYRLRCFTILICASSQFLARPCSKEIVWCSKD